MANPPYQASHRWSAEELAALGEAVALFGELDWWAGASLGHFVSDRLAHTVLVSGEDVSWKLNKLLVFAEYSALPAPVQKELTDWCQAMRKLVERRNQLMHSLFVYDEGFAATLRLKASTRGGKWSGRTEPVDLEALRRSPTGSATLWARRRSSTSTGPPLSPSTSWENRPRSPHQPHRGGATPAFLVGARGLEPPTSVV